MASKQKGKRGIKKEIVRQFERSFDLSKLDYKKRIQPIKPKAMLYGLGAGSLLYGIAFGFAYLGVSNNVMPLESFAKFVWIIMVPTTVVGLFVWLLVKNRMEYPIRQDILKYVAELEHDDGLLWRFSPVIDYANPNDYASKKIFNLSREGKSKELAVEDYTEVIDKLKNIMNNMENRNFDNKIAEEILVNFDKTEAAL